MKNYENLNFSKLRTCNQLWEDMVPTNVGRTCKKCSRTIVDFTRKTNEEIARIHVDSVTGVCGYYKSEQVKPRNRHIKSLRFSGLRTVLLTGISYLTIVQTADGKQKSSVTPKQEQRSKLIVDSEQIRLNDNATSSLTVADSVVKKVTGTVIFKSDGSRAPGVVVIIQGTTIGTTTDAVGQFTLWLTDIPDTVKKVKVIAHFIGYIREEKEISTTENSNVEILLDEDISLLTDFIIVAKVPWYKKIWRGIKRPFRKRVR
jgi:CarboxypepD_reg-like domain